MQALRKSPGIGYQEEPASQYTQAQLEAGPRLIPVEQLQLHLVSPNATDPVVERAYDVWHEVWLSTWREAHGTERLYSDDFTRQSAVGALTLGTSCIAVTGIRWLDLSQPRHLQDSYFKLWPQHALAQVAGRSVCIGSNTAVHPQWRRALIAPANDASGEMVRVSFAMIAMTIRCFAGSSADCLLALTRNDRSIDRVLSALGARPALARIQIAGNDTDIVCMERDEARPIGPIIDNLWARRRGDAARG